MPENANDVNSEIAVLAGGCFWCLEAVYERLRGVLRVASGYMGGDVDAPTYEQVCGGDTGHAEVVRVEFDPAEISYREVIEVFFTIHDPTTLNRQGNDVGTQYRSAIFYLSTGQRDCAQSVVEELTRKRVFPAPIVTEIVAATTFYVAEHYHQRYFEHNPNQPYCQFVVSPKVTKFRKQWASRLKP